MRTQERASTRRLRSLTPLVLGLLLATAPLVAQDAATGSPPPSGAHQLTLANGAAFYATDNPLHDARKLSVPGSDLTLHVWQETRRDGDRQSLYAVSQAGERLLGRVRETTHVVRLNDFRFDPLTDGPPGLSVALSARSQNRLFLVQLEAAPLPEMRQAITDLGGQVRRFLTDHTFIVEMTPKVRARVHQLDFVRWVGPYQPGMRLERTLREGVDSSRISLPEQRYSIQVTERRDAQRSLVPKIEALGGVVVLVEPGGLRVEAMLTKDQLRELVHLDEVHFVDRWGGPGEVDMNIVRSVGGADYVEGVAGYTGQGVRGEIFDTELYMTHQEWSATPILHSNSNTCGGSLHGTSCYSNNFATGVDSSARGIVPDATGMFYCYGESTQFGGSTSRYTANAELIDPAGPYRAVYQTSSVGSSRTFNYTTLSAETDDYLFLHQILSTQSQSNAGNQDSRPQAWSKNIVSVGGIRHLNTASRCDDYHGSSGSTGPAEDGRIKPDLSFFYDSIQSATGSGSTDYTGFGGTSSATPQTSGYFGLLFQMWHEGTWSGHGGGATVFDSRPKMATAKALMINNAYRYDWANPGSCDYGDANRYRQGWGTADAQRLYDRAPKTSVIDETDVITPLETISYNVTVTAGETELNVTMVYVDPAGTVGAAHNRVNDLSLRVTAPGGGTVYWGNNGLTAGNVSSSGGSSNTIDTVENVFIQNPAAGDWTVDVIADEIVEDAHTETGAVDADFALVVSGGQIGGGCSPGAFANAGVDRTINDGDSTTLGVAAQSGHTYSWSPGGATTAQITVSPSSTTTYTLTATTVCGSAQDTVTVTILPPGQNGPQDAVYDAGLGTPACAVAGSSCDSTTLVNGRATLGPEPNQPNTLDGCADGTSGSYHSDESNDAIVVSTLDGLNFSEGATVQVDATVYAYSTGSSDTLDLYYAADASSPVWTLISSTVPSAGGVQTISAQYTLSAGSLQAVRASFRYQGSAAACSSGSYDDADDLVFAVEGGTPDCSVDADCDDGAFCNGSETCNAGSCQAGTAPNCDDGVSCTDDSCNEGTDSCDNAANDAACDNGAWCDGAETCSATLDCQAGSDPCGAFGCDEVGDVCFECSVDADCDDGAFCNGAETCNAGSCGAGSDPCPGQSCDEGGDVCSSSNGPQDAVYDVGLGAPACAVAGSECDSLALVDGRGTVGPEPNQPNTLDACTDGTSGTYHSDESNDALVVKTLDGADFTAGATVQIDATVYSWSTGTSDHLDLYYAADATSPVWTLITTLDLTSGGVQTLSAQYTLPAGSLQAVRANFRYNGSPSSCSTGSYDDADDLVFAVGGGTPECSVDADCDNGQFCDGAETCNAGSCQAGSDPCPGQSCDEGGDVCVPVAGCTLEEDFESGANGWTNDAASTCTTGAYVSGNPTNATDGYQIVGSHGGVSSLFTAVNTTAGGDDVDSGNCILGSPSWAVANASTLSVWYWHGQRDAADDAAGDFFTLEYSTDGGSSWTTLASNGDTISNPAWAEATAAIPAGANVQVRMQCSDGAGPGDIVECGIDDVSICE
jgi:serine protease AprX